MKIVLDAQMRIINKKDIDKRRAVGFGSLWEVRGPWTWLVSHTDRASDVTGSEQGEGCALAAHTCLSGPGDRELHLLGSNCVRAYGWGGAFIWLITFSNPWNYSCAILSFDLIFRGNSSMKERYDIRSEDLVADISEGGCEGRRLPVENALLLVLLCHFEAVWLWEFFFF